MCGHLAVQLYRKLEKFLIRNRTTIKLKHIHKLKEAIPPILNPQLLGNEGQSLLTRHLARCYDIEDSSVDAKEAKKLYLLIEEKLTSTPAQLIEQAMNSAETVQEPTIKPANSYVGK